jgi:hypothetical protein
MAEQLAKAAVAAGEAMVELQVRGPHADAADLDPLRPGSLGSTTIDPYFALRRELLLYVHATRRSDGIEIIKNAVTHSHGAGTARLTLLTLDEIREIILVHMQREGQL